MVERRRHPLAADATAVGELADEDPQDEKEVEDDVRGDRPRARDHAGVGALVEQAVRPEHLDEGCSDRSCGEPRDHLGALRRPDEDQPEDPERARPDHETGGGEHVGP